jgi:GntR family transcriptional regulator / MocR family aminotransferase
VCRRQTAAGFHAVAHLPADADEHHIVTAARERSVDLYGMSSCRASRAARPAQLVLDFGNVSERAIAEGIASVGDLLTGPP